MERFTEVPILGGGHEEMDGVAADVERRQRMGQLALSVVDGVLGRRGERAVLGFRAAVLAAARAGARRVPVRLVTGVRRAGAVGVGAAPALLSA
jgi:hypothetical protein